MDKQTFHANHVKLVKRAATLAPFDAEDLAQEVYLRLLKARVPQPWNLAILFQTLNWAAIDRYRKIRNLPTVPLLDHPDQPEIEQALFARQLLAADPHGRIVELSVIDGLTPAEIAALTGTNSNTVGVRKHRALGRMRAMALAA